MKNIGLPAALLLLLTGMLTACSKNETPDEPNPPGGNAGVYVAYSSGEEHSNRRAAYWKDGTDHLLADRTSKVYVNSLAVDGSGNVYTAGCECTFSKYPNVPNQKDDSCKVTLWKNEQRQQLTIEPFSGISDAFVALSTTGDVFVVSTEPSPSGDPLIRLWKNGVPQDITDGTNTDEATALWVQGTDVYIGASRMQPGASNATAVLFKNGAAQTLSNTTSYYDAVKAIAVSGNDVYAAVQEEDEGFLVKNGDRQAQPSGLIDITDVSVSGSDVYVMGKPNDTTTAVYKNGALLYNLNSTAGDYFDGGQKMYIKGSDVYVSGVVTVNGSNQVVVWKNGTIAHTVTSVPNQVTTAQGLFVK